MNKSSPKYVKKNLKAFILGLVLLFLIFFIYKTSNINGSASQDSNNLESTNKSYDEKKLSPKEEIKIRSQLEYVIKSDSVSVRADESTIASWFRVAKKSNLSEQLKENDFEQLVNKKTIISLLDIMADSSEAYLQIDHEKVDQFISGAVKKLETPPINQVTAKYASGRPPAITKEGRNGRGVANVAQIKQELLTSVETGRSFVAMVEFKELAFQQKTVTINDNKRNRTVTYQVVAWGSIKSNLEEFAAFAAQTYADSRGWSQGGVTFQRVHSGGNFSLVLAEPARVAGAGTVCDSFYSCRVGRNVIINDDRWRGASPSWNNAGGSLADYRRMVINHETGHWLGFGHRHCSGPGQPAAVMQQQSISLQGCAYNPWPTPAEISSL